MNDEIERSEYKFDSSSYKVIRVIVRAQKDNTSGHKLKRSGKSWIKHNDMMPLKKIQKF